MRKFVFAAAMSMLAGGSAAPGQSGPSSEHVVDNKSAGAITEAEAVYADVNDAGSIVGAIDSGLFREFRGKDRTAWQAAFRSDRATLARKLGAIAESSLSADDARVYRILQAKLESFAEPTSAAESSPRCNDAQRKEQPYRELSAALESCFTEIANNLEFEGERLDRVAALGRLASLDDPQRRKALFLAFVPLWKAVNGANEPDSPYRRLIALAAEDARSGGSAIDAAARTVGISPNELEQWLVRMLEAWSAATPAELIEPWDYRHDLGGAERKLARKVPLQSLLQIDHRFYRDLGADLDALGVRYDLEPRPDKSSVAYTDFLVHGRWVVGQWQPTIARVLATYRDGGLGSLNELVHENGHAVHISAIRNRPAYLDWNDDLFVEAFADVSSWSLYEESWQRRYLGSAAAQADSLRALFGGVMLDVAWALFERRMLRDPHSDPNAVWTDITHRYLHIVPHPELAWWAVRVQLVDLPGYMINYGLGASLTADIRARVREQIGPFDAGNPRWYPWLSEHLLRFGSERDTPALLREFLGRPLSVEALLQQIGRIKAQKRAGA